MEDRKRCDPMVEDEVEVPGSPVSPEVDQSFYESLPEHSYHPGAMTAKELITGTLQFLILMTIIGLGIYCTQVLWDRYVGWK